MVLPEGASGKTLTLADVFKVTGQWEEARFDIADQSNVPGLGATITSCGENNGAELEIRLAHRFEELVMNVGQANNSKSSDLTLAVQIVANGAQQDSQTVPFDHIQAMTVNIKDVNALKIRLSLEGKNCTGGAIAVISGLQVSG